MSANKRDGLLAFLHSVKENRGAMANLRCALVKSRRYRAWPLVARFGGIGEEHQNMVVRTVAGLYATHPEDTDRSDFGSLCRRLMSKEENDKLFNFKTSTEVGPVSRRFQHFLAAERGKEINERTVRLVLRMKAEGIPVNYADLYDGLMFWGDKMRNRWAGSFWHAHEMEEAAL